MVSLASGVAIPRTRALDKRAFRFNKGYLLVLPAVIYVLALIGFPLGMGIWYSLTDATVARDGRFIGLKNFVDVLRDPTFGLALRNTLIIAVVATAAKITLSVALAFLLLGAFPGRSFLRTLFVLTLDDPDCAQHDRLEVDVPLPVQRGELDAAQGWPHRSGHSVARDTRAGHDRGHSGQYLARRAVWSHRRDGRADGAPRRRDRRGPRGWRQLVAALPARHRALIAPILFIALLFDLIFTLTELTVVFLLTSGGPVDQTQVLANYALQVGVSGSQLGEGAAIALFLLPVLILLTVFALRSIARREAA